MYSGDVFVADEVPTTNKWNKLWTNDASFNSGVGIADDAIITRHLADNAVAAANLATNAITLGYAQITSNFTVTASLQAVTGLSVTVTIPAGSRRVKITAYSYGLITTGGATTGTISVWDGTVGSGTQLSSSTHTSSAAGDYDHICCFAVVSPAAGSKTYSVGAQRDSVDMTFAAAPSSPAFILVEAI